MKRNIAILASGNGSNAENIFRYFEGNEDVAIALILTNNPQAGVLERARRLQIPARVMTRTEMKEPGALVSVLQEHHINWVVLAGFLALIPGDVVRSYHRRILNIHPSLLPKFGGKGLYGDHVHEAVLAAGETESGITIHYIDEDYDRGERLLQAFCTVSPEDTPESLAGKIHRLEYYYYPRVIERELLSADE